MQNETIPGSDLSPVEQAIEHLVRRGFTVVNPVAVMIRPTGEIAVVDSNGDYLLLDAIPDLCRAAGRPLPSLQPQTHLTPKS